MEALLESTRFLVFVFAYIDCDFVLYSSFVTCRIGVSTFMIWRRCITLSSRYLMVSVGVSWNWGLKQDQSIFELSSTNILWVGINKRFTYTGTNRAGSRGNLLIFGEGLLSTLGASCWIAYSDLWLTYSYTRWSPSQTTETVDSGFFRGPYEAYECVTFYKLAPNIELNDTSSNLLQCHVQGAHLMIILIPDADISNMPFQLRDAVASQVQDGPQEVRIFISAYCTMKN